MILRPRPVYFAEWSGVRCDWQRGVIGRDVFPGTERTKEGTTPCCDRKSAEITQNTEDRRAPSRKRVRNLMILLDLWVCDKREKTCGACAG